MAPAQRGGKLSAPALAQHVEHIRAQLARSFLPHAPSGSGLGRIDLPAATLDTALEAKSAFEPYRRFVAAHQRQMENALRQLRSQVRGQLQKGSPRLQQLATLDAAFEQILAEQSR